MSDSPDVSVPPALVATPRTREALGEAAPWLKFLTIVGYIGVGFLAVVAVVLLILGAFIPTFGGVAGVVGGLLYLAIAAVLFFAVRILGRLAKAAKAYKAQGDAADLEKAVVAVRGLALFYGIYTIVFLVLLAVVVICCIFFAGILFSALKAGA